MAAAAELVRIADWDGVLTGARRSSVFDGNPNARLALPDGTAADLRALTNMLTCGHVEACTGGEFPRKLLRGSRPMGCAKQKRDHEE